MTNIASILNKATIIQEAKNRAQLDDFGDLFFDEALTRLLSSLINDAQLTMEGAYGQYERCVNLLVNRLRMEQQFKQHPEIELEEVKAPVIIVGLPRTGTTLLSRMLSSSPEFYTLYWWECRNPAPFPASTPSNNNRDPRIDAAEEMIEQILDAVPELAAIHPFDAQAHDEEVILMEHGFYSTVPEASAWVPSYQTWLEKQDQTRAYADLKRMLKFLQWQKKRRGVNATRWVLKTPHHLHFMQQLHETFPDALIIQTHRDPVDTLPSLTSMYHRLYELVSKDVDKEKLGKSLLDKWSASMRRCLTFRENTAANILDINYLETVKKPTQVVKKIFKEIGIPFTAENEQHIAHWLEENKRESREKHEYNMADYGLNRASIDEAFKSYKQKFIAD